MAADKFLSTAKIQQNPDLGWKSIGGDGKSDIPAITPRGPASTLILFDIPQKINHDHKNYHGERGGNRDQHKRMHGYIQFEPATLSMLGGGIVLYRSDHML